MWLQHYYTSSRCDSLTSFSIISHKTRLQLTCNITLKLKRADNSILYINIINVLSIVSMPIVKQLFKSINIIYNILFPDLLYFFISSFDQLFLRWWRCLTSIQKFRKPREAIHIFLFPEGIKKFNDGLNLLIISFVKNTFVHEKTHM